MSLVIDDPIVGLAGDWHGSAATVAPAAAAFASRGIRHVFHAGDFGFWHGNNGHAYLSHANRVCERHNICLYVTPGNHEDWEMLDAAFAAQPGELIWVTDRIAALPRGFRATVAGQTLLSVGGAASVDQPWRTPFVDWWPSEEITYSHIRAAIDDGPTDVLLTHESPNGGTDAVRRIVTGPSPWPEAPMRAAAAQRELITELWTQTRPKFLAHGHYHVAAHQTVDAPWGEPTVVMALNDQDKFGNLATLDLTGLPEAKFVKTNAKPGSTPVPARL